MRDRPIAPYRGAAEIAAWLRALPARVEVAGRTARGEEILAVTIGEGERASAVLAGLHPIEWIGVEAALALIERLAAAPPRDRRVIALPLINVDGYLAVEADRRAGRRRWHRRNAAGVDLNRNFPAHWRAGGWHGRAAADQPEIAAVLGALRLRGVDRAVSLHSIGRKLLLPWAGRVRRPRAWPELEAAARAIAARMPEPYAITQVSRWLPGARAWGAELDWLHGDLGALAILVECTLGGFDLRDPASWIDPFRWYNPADPARHADGIAAALEAFVRGG